MRKYLRKTFNLGFVAVLLIMSTTACIYAQDLNPAISVQPSTQVEVGEEVFLSATGTKYPDSSLLAKARYEWDFGDGYTFKFGYPYSSTSCSGIAVTHYYMKPGDFTVTLTVSIWSQYNSEGDPIGSPVIINNSQKVISVIGEAPLAGFEIQRASFHNRLAQYLYVIIPSAYRGNNSSLNVKLVGSGGATSTLFKKKGLAAEEKILLNHRTLSQGDYVVIAELFDTGGNRVPGGIWRDKFSKRYSTIPKVGIDENNSFRINGEVFFPIGPFMTDVPKIENFVTYAGINILHTEGYYSSHSSTTWSDYLDKAAEHGLLAIGPARGDYEVSSAYWNPSPVNRWKFNHNTDIMAQYVKTNKDHSSMFAWSWQDEPNLGGRAHKVYPPTLAAWGYSAHREDPDHPSFNLFYGYDWSRYYGTQPTIFDYLASAPFFGGKKWVQDAIPFDIYPIQGRLHSSLNMSDMGPYAIYLDALDRMQINNKSLVPVIPGLQPCRGNINDLKPPVTEEQVYMEAWLNVIHGAKGIIWFPYFDQSTIRWSSMKKFADQMKVLAPIVLAPAPNRTVSDNANAPLNRVDTMIREKDGYIYIISARVTEPDPLTESKYQGYEPDFINVEFTITGLGDILIEVIDEGRNISMSNGKFTDTFIKNAAHIYKLKSPHISTPQGFRIKHIK